MIETIQQLVGQRVQVWTNGAQQGFTDTGTLVAFEDPWLVVHADSGLLCFPLHNVRLVKAVGKTQDAHVLPG
jgi:hypothetical protein